MKTFQLQFIFLSALVFSMALTPLFAGLARRWKIIDRPTHRKTHKEPVPYLGGVALLTSILLVFFLAFGLGFGMGQPMTTGDFTKALFILSAALGMVLVGLWDDVKNIRPRYKLIGQVVLALLFSLFGFCFQVLHLPGLPPVHMGLLCVPVTVFWIVAVVNAFNMIDGIDGLAATVAAGSLILLAAASALVGNDMELMLAVTALGAVAGFLVYNWKPAKIYLGDAGSGGLGMFLACALVALGQDYGQASFHLKDPSLGQPFFYQIIIVTLLVGYPALEILLSVARRFLHGRPISRADRGHIHHRLLKAGWSVSGVCLTALSLTFLLGLAALATIAKQHGLATWLLSVCGVTFGLGLSALGFLDFLKPKVVQRLRPHYQIAHHFISMQRAKLGLSETREEVLALINQTCQEFGVKKCRLIVMPGKDGNEGIDYSREWDLSHQPEYLGFIRPSSEPETGTFSDSYKLSNGSGGAHWVFEPNGEEELDVEYRVLVSEFMREALDVAIRLGEHKASLNFPSVASLSHKSICGHSLHKRHKSNGEALHPVRAILVKR